MDEERMRPPEPEEVHDPEIFDLDVDEVAEEENVEGRGRRLSADSLLDRIVPGDIDWRDLVRRHPVATVTAVAAVGFLVGRARGGPILAALSGGITSAVMRQLSDVLDGEVFEF